MFSLFICRKQALQMPFPPIWEAFQANIFLCFMSTHGGMDFWPPLKFLAHPWLFFCGRPWPGLMAVFTSCRRADPKNINRGEMYNRPIMKLSGRVDYIHSIHTTVYLYKTTQTASVQIVRYKLSSCKAPKTSCKNPVHQNRGVLLLGIKLTHGHGLYKPLGDSRHLPCSEFPVFWGFLHLPGAQNIPCFLQNLRLINHTRHWELSSDLFSWGWGVGGKCRYNTHNVVTMRVVYMC